MKLRTSSLLSMLALFAGHALSQPISFPKTNLWVASGTVWSLLETNGIIYLGGDFNYVGPNIGGGVSAVDISTAKPDKAYPFVNGVVKAILPDGNGGQYIGGEYSSVGDVQVSNLAHVLVDKTVDAAWHPNPDGSVYALELSGNRLYVGGGFSSVGGTNRNYICALDAASGQVLDWNPNAANSVNVIKVAGGLVYAGGAFNTLGTLTELTIGNRPRNYVAALDPITGTATDWNPKPDSFVNDILVVQTNVFIAGGFTFVNGQSQPFIAALDTTTGTLIPTFNPNPDQAVYRMLSVNGNIYFGGSFTTVSGQSRRGLAAIDAQTGALAPWNPPGQFSGSIETLSVSSNTLYAGGSFSSFNGESRAGVVASDLASGALSSWNPGIRGVARALAVVGNTLYIGGDLFLVGAVERKHLAAIDATTGDVTPWKPDPDDSVLAIAVQGNLVYVGGQFTHVGGQARSGIAAIDGGTAIPTSWNPNSTGSPFFKVTTILPSNGIIYVGGAFDNIGGQRRNRIAALDAATGVATSWNPDADGIVNDMALADTNLFVAGAFGIIGGTNRSALAALDVTTGNATDWKNVLLDNEVRSVAVDGTTVYAGGFFTTISNQWHPYLAAFDLTSAALKPWNPRLDGRVLKLAVTADAVYTIGEFLNVSGLPRQFFAAIDKSNGSALRCAPNPDIGGSGDPVLAIALSPEVIYLGGNFTTLGGRRQPYFAGFNVDSCLESPTRLPTGEVQFGVTGIVGNRYIIQASTDLNTWAPVTTNVAPFVFRDSDTLNPDRRYYRALQVNN